MQFAFSEEQQAFAQSLQRFGARPRARSALPVQLAKLMSAQGLMGITLPEAEGGRDADWSVRG